MIRVLPPEVINQIAAGEVVERPFSVLKELVENAVDAGATRIEVRLEGGGTELVGVRDDGRGMSPEDLALAFTSHATSKLASLADLEAIASMGFRGEALASIGSVSRARVLTRTADSEEGAELRVEGGRIGEVAPAAAPVGTLVEVRDLFHNVPARRRFLRSARGERTRCVEVLTRMALAHEHVGFSLEGHRQLSLPPGEGLERRIGRLFGDDTRARLLPVGLELGGVRVSGYVVDPDGARRDRSGQHLFVNGRPIQDRSLAHAVHEAFRPYLMPGRFAVTFLYLQLDPREVDVNVHPQKSEVRFHKARVVFSAVHRAVADALEGRARRVGLRQAGAEAPATGFPELPPDLFGRPEAARASVPPRPGGGRVVEGGAVAERPARGAQGEDTGGDDRGADAGGERGAGAEVRRAGVDGALPFGRCARFLQVHDTYLVFETTEGFAIVDQHALHERVVYERLLREARAGEVRVQRLLLPLRVDLAPADKELLLAHGDTLRGAGLLLADFGGSSILLEGVPAVLRRVDAQGLVDGVLAALHEGGGGQAPGDVLERFHSAACRIAVKAGDRLDDSEIELLLDEARHLEHPHNCPHGRPTVLNFGLAQLERWFKRRV